MLMYGEKFSVIPLTTHINLNDVKKFLNKKNLDRLLKEIIFQTQKKIYKLMNFIKLINCETKKKVILYIVFFLKKNQYVR